MDYSTYYSSAPQPYPFMGMPPTPNFSHGLDPETIRSIVRPLPTHACMMTMLRGSSSCTRSLN
jgi:hypothetical protein